MGKRLVAITVFTASGFIYGWAMSYVPAPHDASAFWIGNLCAPWLVIAFLAGYAQLSWASSVFAGAAAEVACVLGFYSRTFDLHARWGDDPNAAPPSATVQIQHFLHVDEHWFAAALLAGALYGAIGRLRRRTRSIAAGLVVAAGFLAEPALWPLYNGFYKGPWFVWAAEIAVGIMVAGGFTVTSRRSKLRPLEDPSP
jgi:hypothetical protein